MNEEELQSDDEAFASGAHGSQLPQNETISVDATVSKSTDPAPAPKANGFSLRRLLQFRLRTLLLLTVAAAFYTQWSLRPEPETEQFGDYQIFHHQIKVEKEGMEEMAVNDGAYWVTDKDGRLLVRGAFNNGSPTGKWRTYHTNGRLASIGSCDDGGGREGVWKSYYPNGRLMQKLTYGQPRERQGPQWEFSIRRISVREGSAEGWHENGQLYWRGQFRDDLYDGDWEFFDLKGQRMAKGGYVAGRRHGRWEVAGEDAATRTVYFVHGRETPDPKQVDETLLEKWINGRAGRERVNAIDLATHTGRWKWLASQLEQAASPLQSEILRAAIPYEGLAQPMLEASSKLEQSSSQKLRAIAMALRYSADVENRPELRKKLASLPPASRRLVALELVDLDPYHFREALRTDDKDISQFALQCLLCRWADRRNDYGVRIGEFPQGPNVRTVLRKANEDPEIPKAVRELIAQWLQDTGPKGMAGGFF